MLVDTVGKDFSKELFVNRAALLGWQNELIIPTKFLGNFIGLILIFRHCLR